MTERYTPIEETDNLPGQTLDAVRKAGPAALAYLLTRRFSSGQDDPERVGRSLLSGGLGMPAAYANLSALVGLGGKEVGAERAPIIGPTMKLMTDLAPQTAQTGQDIKNWARQTAGIDQPRTDLERAAEGTGGALTDPLSYTPLNPLKGLLPSVVLSAGANMAFPEPEKERFAGGTTQSSRYDPVEPVERYTPVESKGWSTGEILATGGAAALAALLGKKILFPRTSLSKLPNPVGNSPTAVGQRVSGTTPTEVVKGITTDAQAVPESQFTRSLPDTAGPTGRLDVPEQEITTYGAPRPGTFGSEYLAAQQRGMAPAPTTLDPAFDPALTPGELVRNMHQRVSDAIPGTTQVAVDEFMRTGALKVPDGRGGYQVRIGPRFFSIAQQAALQPGAKESGDAIMALRQALDEYSRTGKAPMLTELLGTRPMINAPSGVRIPLEGAGQASATKVARARQLLRQHEAVPGALQYAEGFEALARFLAEVAPQFRMPRNLIAKMMRRHPHFVPLAEQGADPIKPSFFERLRKIGGLDTNIENASQHFDAMFFQRATEHGKGVQMPKDFGQQMERYITSALHTFHRNYAQDSLFYGIRNSRDANIRKSFSVFKKGEENNPAAQGATWFWSGDTKVGVKFEDALMNFTFKFQPSAVRFPLWSGIRRIFQQTVTGLAQPLFIPFKGLPYDTAATAITRPAGSNYKMGLLARAGITRLGVDPTASIEAGTKGVAEVLSAKRAEYKAVDLERALMRDPAFVQSVGGPQVVRRMADAMWMARINSDYAQLRRSGAVGISQFLERSVHGNRTRLDAAVPEWKNGGIPAARAWRLWDYYKDVMEGLSNANRIGYFKQNKARPFVETEAAEIVGKFSRQGTGRLSGKGGDEVVMSPDSGAVGRMVGAATASKLGSTAAGFMRENVPYHNVAIQATRKLVDAMRKNPLTTIGGLTTTIGLPAVFSAVQLAFDEEARNFWLSQPGYVQASTLYIRLPFLPPERGLFLPIPPELSVFHAMTFSGVLAMTGKDVTATGQPAHTNDAIMDSLVSWLNVFTPIQAAIFGSMAGLQVSTRASSLAQMPTLRGIMPGVAVTRGERVTGEGISAQPSALNLPFTDKPVPAWIDNTMANIFGQAYIQVRGMMEAWAQAEKRGGQDPALAALTQAGNDALRRTPVLRPIHGFFAQPAMTNIKRRFQEKQKVVDQVTNMADAVRKGYVSNTLRGPGVSGTPLDPALVPEWSNDPVKVQRAYAVKVMFDQDKALRFTSQLRNTLRADLEKLRAVRPLTRELQKEINKKQFQEIALVEQMYKSMKEKEKLLGFKLEDTLR